MRAFLKFFGVFSALVALSLVGCSDHKSKAQEGLSAIKERGILRVGVFSDKPPFGFVDSKGQYQGFDVYIAKRMAKDLLGDAKKIQFIPVEAAARVEFLKANKVDVIMANFTKTREREAVVDFAKPYMKVALGVVSKGGVIKSVADLKSKNQPLIVNKGTTADFYFSRNYPYIHLLKYDQNTETFLALKNNRGIALAHDNTLLFAWVKQNPEFKVGIPNLGEQDVIAPAVKKGDKALLDWLDQEIDKLTKSGFMKEAYNTTLKPIYGNDINPSAVIFEQ
ncbi:cysteine ABC transporter substrate-binding protein [Helicobacter suis]|uniref:Glutamine ABC transporter, periplasmic glutamine-binding protein n=2 Tax=Helicobacter suis TaxID=104628 RepID=E7G4P9_9HELI|nr:cysteine ABC transporter substrate-binding protein [Helicobacter suis]EFX41644.1 glutamine ABC transporter, periplasmic glutamine-binding protein [Helicobacter suis HS5]EFX43459.1 glutamine ABC transporter, periplasmic glutamine-binding protein [Helicobacter suis HS1]BCD46201.1 Glutamine ABC transporter, periplasmic glutamine-binding protein GlnH [Helicobacter suis]BCD47882.1 Glutamine ABC transporter, periplasmic glutamine-binding protein GlnH [Helicobacter suis]BCD49642.1 Glutamine ABC tr